MVLSDCIRIFYGISNFMDSLVFICVCMHNTLCVYVVRRFIRNRQSHEYGKFSLHSNISYNSCLLEGIFPLSPPPCHVLLLFANLLYLYVCLNADGCVGVRMFDGSYVCVCVFFLLLSLRQFIVAY